MVSLRYIGDLACSIPRDFWFELANPLQSSWFFNTWNEPIVSFLYTGLVNIFLFHRGGGRIGSRTYPLCSIGIFLYPVWCKSLEVAINYTTRHTTAPKHSESSLILPEVITTLLAVSRANLQRSVRNRPELCEEIRGHHRRGCPPNTCSDYVSVDQPVSDDAHLLEFAALGASKACFHFRNIYRKRRSCSRG